MGILSQDLAALDTDMMQATNRILQQAFKYGLQGDLIFGECLVADQALMTVSATKNYHFGTRRVTPYGDVFHYAKNGVALTNAQIDYSLYFAGEHKTAWYVAFTHTALASATSVTCTGAASLVTLNELIGGYIFIMQAGVANQVIRRITGNTASEAGSPYDYTVSFAEPLPYAITTSDHFEIMSNPWANVRPAWASPSATHTMCGYAPATADANSYIWVKTAGIHRVSLPSTPGDYQRSVYFGANGCCVFRGTAGTTDLDQRAGILILPGTEHSAFIMLELFR